MVGILVQLLRVRFADVGPVWCLPGTFMVGVLVQLLGVRFADVGPVG
jgi:hypothetical protein